ncbi:helix-turn-helix domain-containing protein [Vibrio cyclitrophicus]
MKTTYFAGIKIKGLRLESSLSLAETAEILDITPSYLSLIENGKKQPSKKILAKAAKQFDVSIASFNESPQLLEDLEQLTKDSDLSELIAVFDTIIKKRT